MAKKIVTVGFEIPGHSEQYLPIGSDQSLLDYDIIGFTPDISALIMYGGEYYNGKPCLSDTASFSLKEKASRWRQELLTAFQHGKTIFVYMCEFREVFVATGRVTHSGTGRSRVTTRHVEVFDNFKLLPVSIELATNARGQEMKPVKSLGLLSSYWAEFRANSQYEVYFESKMIAPLIATKTGNKTVAGVVRAKAGSKGGAIFFLPPVHYDEEAFTQEDEGPMYWNRAGLAFGRKWSSALTAIDAGVGSELQRTPPPEWVTATMFTLQNERVVQTRITETNAQIEALELEKRMLLDQLQREGSLRNLLYETGPLLEEAILNALQILGVDAQRFKNGDSEFDVVFTWQGTRFLGEAEGKDTKAVNVDKISQLERNLSEDFARDEVTDYARAILFGNAFRLQELSKREDFFTDKCVSTAIRIKAALVRTPDLFFVARHVKESGDTAFGAKCIEAISAAEGTVVVFPAVPSENTEVVVDAKQTAP